MKQLPLLQKERRKNKEKIQSNFFFEFDILGKKEIKAKRKKERMN